MGQCVVQRDGPRRLREYDDDDGDGSRRGMYPSAP